MIPNGKDLKLIPEDYDIGIIRARMIPVNRHNITYMVIDPKKVNKKALEKETENFWLLYKYNHNETIENIMA